MKTRKMLQSSYFSFTGRLLLTTKSILRRTVMLTVSEVMRTARRRRRRRRKTRGRMLESKAAMIQQIFPVIANAVQGGSKVAMPSAK